MNTQDTGETKAVMNQQTRHITPPPPPPHEKQHKTRAGSGHEPPVPLRLALTCAFISLLASCRGASAALARRFGRGADKGAASPRKPFHSRAFVFLLTFCWGASAAMAASFQHRPVDANGVSLDIDGDTANNTPGVESPLYCRR